MKAIFLNKKEIKNLREYLSLTDNPSIRTILQKVENADCRSTDYRTIIYHVHKEAHQEIIDFFRRRKINELDYRACLYITKQCRIRMIRIENYSIYAHCDNGESYDVSYGSRLLFIADYLKTLKGHDAPKDVDMNNRKN